MHHPGLHTRSLGRHAGGRGCHPQACGHRSEGTAPSSPTATGRRRTDVAAALLGINICSSRLGGDSQFRRPLAGAIGNLHDNKGLLHLNRRAARSVKRGRGWPPSHS